MSIIFEKIATVAAFSGAAAREKFNLPPIESDKECVSEVSALDLVNNHLLDTVVTAWMPLPLPYEEENVGKDG